MATLKEKTKTTKTKKTLNAPFSCFTTNFKIGGLEKLWQEAEIKKITHCVGTQPFKFTKYTIELDRFHVREAIQINSIKPKRDI